MPAVLLFLKTNWKLVAAGLIILVLLGLLIYVYNKGEKAGAAGVTNAVQSDTIKKQDAARISKEKTDEEVRNTPYLDRVDGLR